MVWTKKAKLNFYWTRRRKAVETYTQAAQLLGSSVKRAKKKAAKDTSKAYKLHRTQTKDINKMNKQIIKLKGKSNPSKFDLRKLGSLTKKQDKLIVKHAKMWSLFEEKINYKTKGERSDEISYKS